MGSVLSVIVPLRRHVPRDIMCLIIEYCDMGTLKTMSVLNRDYSEEASRRIWMSVVLPAHPSQITRCARVCEGLVRNPHRARNVRYIRIDTDNTPTLQIQAMLPPIDFYASRSPPRTYDRTHALVCRALHCVPGLEHLDIRCTSMWDGSVPQAEELLATTLSNQSFPFALKRLSSGLPVKNGLLGFIRRQPAIEHYFHSSTHIFPPLDASVLPRLKHIHGDADIIIRLSSGRPISHVIFQPHPFKQLASGGLATLSFHEALCDPIARIAAYLPHLTSLAVIVHYGNPERRDDFLATDWLDNLRHFEWLEFLRLEFDIFSPSPWETTPTSHREIAKLRKRVARLCTRMCPHLRRIHFSSEVEETFCRARNRSWPTLV